ncbi:hypothetical protein SNOG_15599 [Parastagonospora nodorum SN15]|uniref:HbrB-like protein n=1 Tax=Phaeosphaeria nodorum (strain SN15 / ATCC MYA-4574 / FGSC 10173) TaxID=321614 RepID=Q0TXX2_PHANO|nr:hypothetical protein SNOG_15599 [Parastagonospora nodorum SN15]EAT76974.2 hypothetical protein SNOG_15599 [Parastagonospora nodorum SN15]
MSSFSPPPQTPTLRRPASLDDSESDGSQATLQHRRSPLPAPARSVKSPAQPQAQSETPPVAHNFSRPVIARGETEHVTHSQGHIGAQLGHRPRQRSQGYFEPSLSSARGLDRDTMPPSQSHLNTSQIAAQAAYAHQNAQHNRKRSTTIPAPGDNAAPSGRGQPGQMSPPPLPSQMTFRTNGVTYQNGNSMGVNRMAATTAANVAFPRSPLHSPGMEGMQQQTHGSPKPSSTPEPLQLQKSKEGKSKMKLFSSKPKNIKVEKQQLDIRPQATLPSPGKIGIGIHSSQALNRMMLNQSTTSLAESGASSSNASLYSSANASTSTLLTAIVSQQQFEADGSKCAATIVFFCSSGIAWACELVCEFHDWVGSKTWWKAFAAGKEGGEGGAVSGCTVGAAISRTESIVQHRTATTEMLSLGSLFGINGLSPDDAWPLLKARVLLIFEGEDPRPPVEDFNALVTVHIKRCVHKRSPILLIEDLNELLQTGFGSLDQTLRHVPDDRLIPHLVEMWLVVFTTILPFLQAVFLPLDLEFRGSGIMSSAQAAEFWGVMLPDEMNTKSPESKNKNIPIWANSKSRITLLMSATSSSYVRPGTAGSARSINDPNNSHSSGGYLDSTTTSSTRSRATSNTSAGSFSSNPASHPATINHLHPPPSQMPPALRQQPMDSAKVTETVGRMLQCVSVLVSLQSGDEAQEKIGRLNKELKYNWLGRGRTGRQRQGFVGPRRGGNLNLAAGGISIPGLA